MCFLPATSLETTPHYARETAAFLNNTVNKNKSMK